MKLNLIGALFNYLRAESVRDCYWENDGSVKALSSEEFANLLAAVFLVCILIVKGNFMYHLDGTFIIQASFMYSAKCVVSSNTWGNAL